MESQSETSQTVSALKLSGLDKTYDRFQKLISQLEIHGEVISQEDANLKLLRSLPSAWNNVALIMRNKADLDGLSMKYFYNNLKVYEAEIKIQSSSSSNSQNVAFVSSEDTSSTNEAVNTAHDVPTTRGMEMRYFRRIVPVRIFANALVVQMDRSAGEPDGLMIMDGAANHSNMVVYKNGANLLLCSCCYRLFCWYGNNETKEIIGFGDFIASCAISSSTHGLVNDKSDVKRKSEASIIYTVRV
ncbi:hypothetical protein Tco_0484104 [Tanacetum coccineum]